MDDVAMLVVGDPFGATTHADLVLRAKQRNIPVSAHTGRQSAAS